MVNNVARKCHLSVEQSEERHRGMREHFPSGTKHSKVLGKYLRLCTKYLNPLLTEAPLTDDFLVIWEILNHIWQRFRQCCSLYKSELVLLPLKEKTIASKGMRQPRANVYIRWRTLQDEGCGFGIDKWIRFGSWNFIPWSCGKRKNTFNKPEEHLMWVPRRCWQKCDRRWPTVHLDVPSEQNRNFYLNLHLIFEVLNMQQGLIIYWRAFKWWTVTWLIPWCWWRGTSSFQTLAQSSWAVDYPWL